MKENYFCGYTIGSDAFNKIAVICVPLGRRVLIIGGKTALSKSLDKLKTALDGQFDIADTVIYGNECYSERMRELYETYKGADIDFVIGVGGGKALDTAKGTAYLLGTPVVTVPTIASTCAASSALSVVYAKNHVFEGFWHYDKPAYHCFIDTQIIADAPVKYLRAGIGDTLAKYYEAEFSARNAHKSYADEMALCISGMCNKPLFADAAAALDDCKNRRISDSLENVILIILISTGMVSMLINEKFNGAAAHALFYGLTNLDGFEKKFLHGDVVGYASIVQLVLDGNIDEAVRLKNFLKSIGIETTLSERGIIPQRQAFDNVLQSAVSDPDMEVIPYEITADMLFDAIIRTENL
ncbi:MAG: iron-containing alcohol dehydrogenase family protein [Clostridiales bacterium]|nr:iron-containing alcohol dehydrogenase family protein [Clostridiales bacterium]